MAGHSQQVKEAIKNQNLQNLIVKFFDESVQD